MSNDTHTQSANGNGSKHAHPTPEKVTRRVLETMIDTALTSVNADPKAFAELTPVMRTALACADPVQFLETVTALVSASLELERDVVDDAITNVRKDHGLAGKQAKK